MERRSIVSVSTCDPIITQIAGTLALTGFELQRNHRILDFGCGSGKDVAAFRRAGYCAFGVDFRDFLQPFSRQEKDWFALSPNPYIYQLPYPDQYFDVIYSTQVLEHLVYYEPALQEIRRVLKPNGAAIHIFPSKWRPIEPHFFCPVGGSVRWWPWPKFWGMLGIVNPSLPKRLSLSERAEINWKASRTNYTYHSMRELKFLFTLHFGDVRFAEKEFVRATLATSWFSRFVNRLSHIFPPVFWVYRHFHTKVAILRGYNSPVRCLDDRILY